MPNRTHIIIITFVVFLDLLAFSMTFPVIPYYVAEFSSGASMVGILSALYAIGQFFCTPIIGRLSDRYGRKPLLLLCIAGSVCGYSLLGFADSLWMLVAGKCVGGLLGATVSLAYIYTSDYSDESTRAQSMGYLGAAFGAAFTVGPAIGGLLSKYGYTLPIKLSATLALVNFIVVFLIVKEPTRHTDHDESPQGLSEMLAGLRQILNNTALRGLLLQWFLFSMAFATFQSNIGLFNKYHLNPRESSMVFATIGILVTIVQAGFVAWLAKRYSEYSLLVACSVIFMVSLFIWAVVWNMTILLILLVPLCFSASMLITLSNSVISKRAVGNNTGSIMGAAAGLDNLTRAATAIGGGVLIEYSGTATPGIIAGGIMLVATWVTYQQQQQAKQTIQTIHF
jgi:MFS transporter, DHA1 family, tetracycline resistance protein